MNEIEIKLRVDNKQKIIDVLTEKGCIFSKVQHQIDTIFLENSVKDFNIKTGMIVLRIRTIGDKHLITLKQRKDNIMESKEIEFYVSDSDLCKDLIQTVGYKEMVTVDKKRITTKYKEFNICIDEVKGLGTFMEIEVLTSENNKSQYYEEKMMQVCLDLGVDITSRVKSHYDTMLYEMKKNS